MDSEGGAIGMRQGKASAVCAAVIAATAWAGLASEATTSFQLSKMAGRTPLLSIIYFYRYFTNQAITILACVMTLIAVRVALGHRMLSARIYAAVLAYVAVMGTVYEALLRRLWSPTGFWLYRDALMHDVLPIATLVFWVFLAPKKPLAWTDAVVWLLYPAAYLLVTLIVGRWSGTYPYPFLDPRAVGVASFLSHAVALALAFYLYGLAAVAMSRVAC